MTKERIEAILREYGIAFTDSLADRLLKAFERIYNAGYEDGIHDGYFNSMIKDGREEKHYGKGWDEWDG